MRSVPVMESGDGLWRADNGCFGIIEAKTANYTIKPEDTGKVFTNRGSSADLTFTLPAAKAGLHFRFQKAVIDKDIIVVTPTGVKVHGGSGATQGETVTSNTDTQYAAAWVYCDGTAWWVANQLGTWAIS